MEAVRRRSTKRRLLAYGFSKSELRLYGLDKLHRIEDALQYLSKRDLRQYVRPALAGLPTYVPKDNRITDRYLGSLGLPVPATIGLTTHRSG